MRDRKQRLTINIVFNLVQDIKLANSSDNTLSCLLLNIKEGFNYVLLL